MAVRRLGVILGDQLDRASNLFNYLDQKQDCLWMAEVSTESTHGWSQKARTALFLSAMRHFCSELVAGDWSVHYRPLNDSKNTHSLSSELQAASALLHPTEIYIVELDDYRMKQYAHQPLPEFYWTAETLMHCLQQTIRQTLDYGYAHHIQRLMVTGLYSLLLGVSPKQIHAWYLAVYVDAVEWVELPNVIVMSQFADGGIMASKPAATGKYIQRMSNHCKECKFNSAAVEKPGPLLAKEIKENKLEV